MSAIRSHNLLRTACRSAWILLSNFVGAFTLAAAVVIHPAPPDAPRSARYIVKVNGKPVFAYDARIGEPRNCSYVLFDMALGDTANVVVEIPAGFRSAKCLPARAGVKLATSGNIVTLQLRRPQKVALLLDDGVDNPLFILASPRESDPPAPGSPGVHYFGPGRHQMGQLRLGSGETLYLAGGAIVTGTIRAHDADHITIRGRGIIDAHGASDKLIFLEKCRNVRIEGITMVDQPSMNWTMTFDHCSDLLIENIKELNGARWSNDGCNFVSCQRAVIRNSLIKTDDDCVCIKARREGLHPTGDDVQDIRIESCFLWNTWAHAVQIGPETNARSISQVLVRDLDVICNAPPNSISYWGALGIFISDQAVISNVTFRDIRVEFPVGNPKLFDFQIAPTQWATSPHLGHIRNIVIDKVRVSDLSSGRWTGVFHGAGSENLIENVTFRDLLLGGHIVTYVPPESLDVNPYVRGLRFTTGH
jgi:hypothetical protein